MLPSDPEPDGLHQPEILPESQQEIDFSDQEHQLLSCPKCNHFIKGSDINIDKMVARCANCQYVFGFANDPETMTLKPEQMLPEGIEILKLKSELDIRLNWLKTTSSGGRKFMLFFTTLWNLILLPFVLVVVVSGNWGILLFISLHLAVGLGLIWHLAAIYLNKTLISITHHEIRIHSMPIPHPASRMRTIDTNSVKQLYVTKYTQSTSNGVPNYAYALYAIMEDGEKISLVRGMNRETQQFMESEIEGYLGIKDIKVPEAV